jgi:UMF1 family MFS transporter
MPDPFHNYTVSLSGKHRPSAPDSQQCIVSVLGLEINTASFAMYTFSVSVLIQALFIISMSGAADHGRFRKTLLLTFAWTGAVATMLFLPIVPSVLVLGAILAIIANTCFGASFVLLNSFLPLLVRHHPEVQYPDSSEVNSAGYNSDDADVDEREDQPPDETRPLLSRTDTNLKRDRPIQASTTTELRLSTGISSYGMGIGYIAALIVQALAITVIRLMDSSLFSLRVALFLIGAWWFIFTFPAAFWLRPRPGPPLHLDHTQGYLAIGWTYFAYSWKQLWRTIKHARQLRDTIWFLLAWFLLSDAIATVSGTAILFAKTSLEMKPAALALITVTATLSGIVGAFSWTRLSAMMGLKPTHTILACICLFELIPLYGLLGYIPAIQRLGVFGLQQPWEMYVFLPHIVGSLD